MFTDNLNPILLNLGILQIRYYGLFAVLAFILGYFVIKRMTQDRRLRITSEQIESFLLYTGVSGILGARLFYILIYNLQYYLQNPLEMIAIWHGGLSAHGSFIGGIIGIYLFSRKYDFDFLEMLDLIVAPLILGLALGRIGNFFNGELFGRITNVQWCVKFNLAEGCRHPSQLYESLYSFVIFFILFSKRKNKWAKGTMLSLFLILYGTFRFFAEFFREPDSQIGYIMTLTTGQWLSILVFIVGLALLYGINRNIRE